MVDYNYIIGSAKTWNLPVKKVDKIISFCFKLLNKRTDLTIGEQVLLIDKKFKDLQEKKCAIFEYGKLVSANQMIYYYERKNSLNKEKDFLESFENSLWNRSEENDSKKIH